ncbi:Anti-sigma-K factor rskA [Rubripirellula lacrimiformis]|uniref:Anti-sigma-K factor rskA n=1 Tax=Rubripirellula lacrimiformis TaxID=1930273 RepID=A0A517N4N3_9BACT|nr:anti-sigma factor [Rubripirellula lacrimiformis]QDT01968.1 Anti-sigma-K factor rskA [Rubripirellula lacrimiformis]
MSSSSSSPTPSEWDELLAGEALGDLDSAELQRLDNHYPQGRPESGADLMRTASALHLALSSKDSDRLPDHLRQKIASDAAAHIPAQPTVTLDPGQQWSVRPGVSMREQIAWLAAAACLLLTIGVWVSRGPEIGVGQSGGGLAMDFGKQRQQLQTSEDHLEISWTPGTTPFDNPVSGDVVWSNSQQSGFMRFVDMPINDPSQEQYQLWIIDPARDDEPIDGGVFDVTKSGEVIVPIDAKLQVIDPAAFAITIEKPGGVVVSTQERLPLLASVIR